ncbi:hypothetical protein [Geomonas sp.]|uniref:DUF4870 family protein n=1 Tax=Geomonas sp. TaxID=2651584 RepID=UPI002B4879A3|nr:hypothetical protein [Geomonas sp.]HJV36194.1 hypothetical protein [Geomonas sp.]
MNSPDRSEKRMPAVVYVCYLAAFLCGLSMVIGVIIAYLSRSRAQGKWYRSHFDYQISIFWKTLLGVLVGVATTWAFGFGILVVICTYIWVLIKCLKGLDLLSQEKEVEATAYRWGSGGRIPRKGR